MQGRSKTIGAVSLILSILMWHTAESARFYICLDAGHGGEKPGTIGKYERGGIVDSVLEKDVNLQVTLALYDTLLAIDASDPTSDFEISLTRIEDDDIEFEDRVMLSNTQNNGQPGDIFISVHHNASTSQTAHGTEVYWCSRERTDTALDTLWRNNQDFLAKRVYAALQNLLPQFKGRGYKDSTLYVLRNTAAWSVLSEGEFLSYPPMAEEYDDPTSERPEIEAGAIARGTKHFIDDDPFVTITTTAPCCNLPIWVDDSLYLDAYYGNWFYDETYEVRVPRTFQNATLCDWNDLSFADTIRDLSPYLDEQEWIAYYSVPMTADFGDYFAGSSREAGSEIWLVWSVSQTQYDREITFRLSRDGWQSYEVIKDWTPIGSSVTEGEVTWVVTAPPYSSNCQIALLAFDNHCAEAAETSGVFSIVPPPPPAPTNLRSSTCDPDFRIQLLWNSAVDVDSHQVFRDGQRVGVTSGSNWEYVDRWLNWGQWYQYKVRDFFYNRPSAFSSPFSATPGPGTPAAPTNLSVFPYGGCLFRFAWLDNSNNEDHFCLRIEYYDEGNQWHMHEQQFSPNTTEAEIQYGIPDVSATARLYARQRYMPCGYPYTQMYAHSNPSNQVTFTNNACPDDGCPMLSVFDGREFVKDNSLLAASEKRFGEARAEWDRCLISARPAPDAKGLYHLRIAETEQEISEFDAVQLVGLRFPKGAQVALRSDGTPVAYSVLRTPSSCVNHLGVDILDLVADDDGREYAGDGKGYLIAEFEGTSPGALSRTTANCPEECPGGGGGNEKIPIIPQIDRPNPNIADLLGKPGNMLTVEAIGADSSWHVVAEIPPRARGTGPTLFDLSPYWGETGRLTLKYSWEYRFLTDQIAIFHAQTSGITRTPARLAAAVSAEGISLDSALVQVDSTVASLRPGETWDLAFTFDDPGSFDAFLLESYGRYNPAFLESFAPAVDSNLAEGLGKDMWLTTVPNPFNTATQVRFHLPRASQVRLAVRDILGRQVALVFSGPLEKGQHVLTWSGERSSGKSLASGIYLCVLESEDACVSRKMTLVK